MDEIDVSDIPKGALLAELYNRARPMGMGVFQAKDDEMTAEQAEALISGDATEPDYAGLNAGGRGKGRPAYFDYLHGRPLKVEINGQTLRTALYDRDHGQGAAERAIEAVRDRQTIKGKDND